MKKLTTKEEEIMSSSYIVLDSINMNIDNLVEPENPPLFILDGVEVESIEDITPEMIESMSVLKNASAIDIFGAKGENGVVLITTKNENKKIN